MAWAFSIPVIAAESASGPAPAPVEVQLFDTVTPPAGALPGESIAERKNWAKIPEDRTDHRFTGAAAVVNDRLAIVLRQGAAGAELYSQSPGGPVLRTVLTPVADSPGVKLTTAAIAENGPGEVAVDATFQEPGGKMLELRYSLATGQVFVKTEPKEGVTALRVAAPCRFVVLPDFFADDIVVDAQEIPVAAVDLPSENFLRHLLPGRDAIVMTVASNRGRDARVEVNGSEDRRQIGSSEMEFGPKGKIWVAVLDGKGIWQERGVAPDQGGKVIDLDWTAPFPAQWRVDWQLENKLTASWEMIAETPSGRFIKYGWLGGKPQMISAKRNRWTTVYGSPPYPCWVDTAGRGHLQPLTKPDHFQGLAVIYPINRIQETPLQEFTVVDLVRTTLGVGPCEYILDVEGQGATMKGRATCSARDAIRDIYEAKQQKQRRADVEKILSDVVIFVKHIRSRIDKYIEFAHEMHVYLDTQKEAHPDLAPFFAQMEEAVKEIDTAVARRKAGIKNPQYVVDLVEDFRKRLLDYEGDDALEQCARITHAIVDVGYNQDELVGECRYAVKVLRQRAGLAIATNPQAAPIAQEIRDRTQKVLRNAASYEAPRH